MTDDKSIFQSFRDWVDTDVIVRFQGCEFGIADQDVENVAWLKLNTKGTISGIKLWSTGHYYCEILTLDKEEPDMAVREELPINPNYSDVFRRFLDRILEIDSSLA